MTKGAPMVGKPPPRAAAAVNAIKNDPLRFVRGLGVAYCLAVAGVSVYTMITVRVAVTDIDAYMRCCHLLWEMILVNLIMPPITLTVVMCIHLPREEHERPANVSEEDLLAPNAVYGALVLLGTFLPILAVTGMRALDRARSAECEELIVRATPGGPPLLISVNLFYLGSNSLFCLACIVGLRVHYKIKKAEYAAQAAAKAAKAKAAAKPTGWA